MPLNATIRLEDHGQDHLEFVIEDGRIIEARPHNAQSWHGVRIHNTALRPGDPLVIQRGANDAYGLPHKIKEVTPLRTAAEL